MIFLNLVCRTVATIANLATFQIHMFNTQRSDVAEVRPIKVSGTVAWDPNSTDGRDL